MHQLLDDNVLTASSSERCAQHCRRLGIHALAGSLILLSGCRWNGVSSSATVIRPDEMTVTRVVGFGTQIKEFSQKNGRLPKGFEDLPELRDRDNAVVDGWGRSLVWQSDGKTVRIISYGRDGMPGGSGLDKDCEARYSRGDSDVQVDVHQYEVP